MQALKPTKCIQEYVVGDGKYVVKGWWDVEPRKKLFILGASRGQVGLYRACRRLGVRSIAASVPGKYPGFDLADEICYVDITKPEDVANAAANYSVDGVATCCMDTGLESLGEACAQLGCSGLSRQAAVDCANKSLMKKRLVAAGVPTASYIEIREESDLDKLDGLGLPVVVKSCESQGSSGVFVAHTMPEARDCARAMLLEEGDCIAEAFVSGIEFGAQALVSRGEIAFVLPHGDITFESHAPIPVGHFIPLDEGQEMIRRAIEVSKAAIRALSLDNCAVNIDIIYSDGECYLLELTGRAGANTLPEIVSAYYGIDYYETIVRIALGERIDCSMFEQSQKAVLGKMLYSNFYGIIEDLSDEKVDERVSDLRFFVNRGDEVPPFASLKDCIGQIAVVGDDVGQCSKLLEKQFRNSFIVKEAKEK